MLPYPCFNQRFQLRQTLGFVPPIRQNILIDLQLPAVHIAENVSVCRGKLHTNEYLAGIRKIIFDFQLFQHFIVTVVVRQENPVFQHQSAFELAHVCVPPYLTHLSIESSK